MSMDSTPLASSVLSVSASRIRELAHIAFNMENVLKLYLSDDLPLPQRAFNLPKKVRPITPKTPTTI